MSDEFSATQSAPAAGHDDPTASTHLRTAWHPLLIMLLERLLPADRWRIVAEYALTREPRRIDAVIIRAVAQAEAWHPDYLRSVLDGLRAHNIVHFKGATDELERADALQVLSYAYQYMALEDLDDPALLSIRVVAPTLTSRFRQQVTKLGGAINESSMRGVHEGTLGSFALRVVETSVAWPHPREHLLFSVSPECVAHPERARAFDDIERDLFYHLAQGIAKLANDPKWKAIMKDADLVEASSGSTLHGLLATLRPEFLLAGLTPEQRLAGLDPAQRLAGLDPAQRLAGLDPAQRLAGLDPAQRLAGLDPAQRLAGLSAEEQVLALSDTLLRALPESFLATLPEHVQAAVRERLAR